MNQLVKRDSLLPATIDQLHKFILVGREKLKAQKAKIKAISIIDTAHLAKKAALADAQDLAEMLLDAEIKLGELLSKIKPKREKESYSQRTSLQSLPSGITKKESHEAQTLFREQVRVEKIKAIARENEIIATPRDAFRQIKNGPHFSSETGEWSTPPELFQVLNSEFQFTLDVCASAKNAKCSRFFDSVVDGLKRKWDGVCWMNPPYGDSIGHWVAKAWESSKGNGTSVVCLLPARVDTSWWWDYCRFGEIRFLKGRLKFGGSETSAPFPSAVVIFQRNPQVIWWEWNGNSKDSL